MAIFFRVMHLSNSCCLQDMLDETGRTKPILIESESKLLGEASFAGALHSTGQWVKANLYAYIYVYIYIYILIWYVHFLCICLFMLNNM